VDNTYAYALVSLRDIPEGEEITVSYTKSGYHNENVDCLCHTCQTKNPPSELKKRHTDTELKVENTEKQACKRTRGGKNRPWGKKQHNEDAAEDAESDDKGLETDKISETFQP